LVGVCGTLLLVVPDDDDTLLIFTVKFVFADDVCKTHTKSNTPRVHTVTATVKASSMDVIPLTNSHLKRKRKRRVFI